MWKKPDLEEFPPQLTPTPQPAAPSPTISTNSKPSPPPIRDCATIGASISIKGDIIGEEDLYIDGKFEGKIELRNHSVTIGKNGRVKGDVYGKSITVEGVVEGNLYGEEQLTVKQTGKIKGNIAAPRVAITNFRGNIDMTPKEKLPGAPSEKS
jgi:cytoskeletal protein CcmA (bactofilin family)